MNELSAKGDRKFFSGWGFQTLLFTAQKIQQFSEGNEISGYSYQQRQRFLARFFFSG